MRTKWFKRNDKWNKVTLSDSDEKAYEEKFIAEYIETFKKIHKKLNSEMLTDEQKFRLAIEIFNKIASPGHYNLERILEEMRDAELAKG